jgi:Collagenase
MKYMVPGFLTIIIISITLLLFIVIPRDSKVFFNINKKENYLSTLKQVDVGQVSLYTENYSRVDLDKTKEAIYDATESCRSIFNIKSFPKVRIIFYDNKSVFENFSKLEYVAGYYDISDRTINMLLPEKEISEDFFLRLSHEYTHYCLDTRLNEMNIDRLEIPMWFHEGIAEYIPYINREYHATSFGILPLKKMTTPQDWKNARSSPINTYYVSYVAVEQIIKIGGEDVIKKILKDVSKGTDFYESLEKHIEMSTSELEKIIEENIILPER